MLGEVVGAVVFPKATDIVHETMVPIEPEIEDNPVQAGLERQPVPVHPGGSLARAVAQEDGEDRANGRCRDQRVDDLGDTDVGDAVALVLITIEEAVDMAEAAEDMEFVDGDGLEGGSVEEEGANGAQVLAGVGDVEVVEGDRGEGMEKHPAVH